MKGIEPIMDRAKSILVAHMPAALDALDAEYADFVLPDIAAFYIEGQDAAGVQLPALYLYSLPPQITPQSGSALMDYLVRAAVLEACDAYGLEHLHRKLWRYLRAIEETLRDHHNEAGIWSGVYLDAYEYHDVETDELTDTYFRAMAVRMRFQQFETY